MAQPAARQREQPGGRPRTTARLLEHDHGGQNCSTKEGNACHQADDKGLRVHVRRDPLVRKSQIPEKTFGAITCLWETAQAPACLTVAVNWPWPRPHPVWPSLRAGRLDACSVLASSTIASGEHPDETRAKLAHHLRSGAPCAQRWALPGRRIDLSPVQSHRAAKIFPRWQPRVPSPCALSLCVRKCFACVRKCKRE
jgi:hypothetical protein